MSSAIMKTPAREPRSWWMESALVDLRHSFWPWLCYMVFAVLNIYSDHVSKTINNPEPWMLGVFLGACISWAAVVTLIFTTDFSHQTVGALVTFPRERTAVWLARSLLCLAMLLMAEIGVPLLLHAAHLAWAGDIMLKPNMQLIHFNFTQLTSCMVLSVLLRKPLAVWPLTFLSPLFLLLIFLWIRDSLTGVLKGSAFLSWGRYSTPDRFPYEPADFLTFCVIAGIIFMFLSWRQWLRLEVRS